MHLAFFFLPPKVTHFSTFFILFLKQQHLRMPPFFNRSAKSKSLSKSVNSSNMRGSVSRSPTRQASSLRQSTTTTIITAGKSPARGGTIGASSPSRTMTVGGGDDNGEPPQPRFPENPSPSTKLRFVFTLFDYKKNLRADVEGFRRTLKSLNIGFTEETILDLFARADANGEGTIDYGEFLTFAANYPLLMESIYSRSKDNFDRANREGGIAAARDAQEAKQRTERDANAVWETAKEQVSAKEREVVKLEESTKEAREAVFYRNKDILAINQELDRSKANRTVKERDFQDAREWQQKATKPLRDTEKSLGLTQERLRNTETDLDACRERERELDAMLEEAKRDTQKHVDMVNDINDNIVELREQVAELSAVLDEADVALSAEAAALKEADGIVRQQKNELEIQEAARADAEAAVKRYITAYEEVRKALIPTRQVEGEKRAIHDVALAAFEASDQVLQQLEAQQAAFDAERGDAELAEQALLENEVRLREQRKNLNTRDDVLWDEGGHFLRVAGRGDTRINTTNGKTRGI